MFYLDLILFKNYYIRAYLIEDIVAAFIMPIEVINIIIKLNDSNKCKNFTTNNIKEMHEYL
jgi:hypothetical protein